MNQALPLSPEELAQRVLELEEEVARLHSQLNNQARSLLTLGGAYSESALPPSQFTIAGLEERVLLVDFNGQIRFANSGMAELLGAPDKQALLRTPLAQWEGQGWLPSGFLAALVEHARRSGQTVGTEQELPDPASSGRNLTLRFVASPMEGRVQVLVQDVTHLRWVERSFERYVSKEVINQLLAVPQHELLRTERRQVTVLFTDLRGFSSHCQQEEPHSVCILLNQHFKHLVDAVHRHQGTVDKLIGDSLMAVFGAPLATSDHALRALLAAVEMLVEHSAWIDRRTVAGWPTLQLSVGIATGEVVVGNVGTPERMDYTVLGHTVNLASRLVHQAKPGQLLTEPATYRKAKESLGSGSALPTQGDMPHLQFSPIGTMQLKNISQPVEVLAVRW